MSAKDIADIEMRLLIEGVFQVYGYDFRDYAEASLRRRLTQWLKTTRFATFSAAQDRVLRDPELFGGMLQGITVNVSEMFRDPHFFKSLRTDVVPHLRTYPFVKIWVAGCSGGEEAYSLAILLEEEGLEGRFRIYATDINEKILKQAEEGIYPLEQMQQYTRNYQRSGGKNDFSDYYTARYDRAILSRRLHKTIVFASHDLATDAGMGEMNMVLCRNVLIYFKPVLKNRILEVCDGCLSPGGFLCLGTKESLLERSIADKYTEQVHIARIYRKRYD